MFAELAVSEGTQIGVQMTDDHHAAVRAFHRIVSCVHNIQRGSLSSQGQGFQQRSGLGFLLQVLGEFVRRGVSVRAQIAGERGVDIVVGAESECALE